METGICTWFGFALSFKETVTLIKDAGFQSVMAWWDDKFEEKDGPKERKPEIIRNAGLKLENVHLPCTGIDAIWEDTFRGQKLFEMFFSYIGDCKTYEIPTAVMHITGKNNPPPYGQLGLDRVKRLVEKAEKDNVTIAFENLRKLEYLDFIFENIESDRAKFCYDSGHENCHSPDIDLLEKYGYKLAALHLHDNNGTGDQHFLPFKGTVNWNRIMTHLKRLDYKGSLALEIDADGTDLTKEFTAHEYLIEAKKRANKLMALLQ